MNKQQLPEDIMKKIEQEAEEYVKRQGSHDKPDITKHDFTQGYIAAYTASVQPLIKALTGLVKYWEFMIKDPNFKEYVDAKEALPFHQAPNQ